MTEKAVVMLLTVCLLIGCEVEEKAGLTPSKNLSDKLSYSEIHKKMMEEANKKCGVFRVDRTKPLFNITGKLTATTIPNSTIYLSITPNVSYHKVMYVVENCMPFWKTTVNASSEFQFNSIIPGKYVTYMPSSRFPNAQGFPIPKEFNKSVYYLNISFHGGDSSSSVCAFEISQVKE